MSIQKNLITLCFATVFTLGLAACGGGGGGAPVTDMTDMTDMDGPDPIIGQREAISSAIAAANAAVGVVTDAATDEEVAAADMAIAAAKVAIADAANVPAEEAAANSGTVAALTAQLSTAKESRQMAMDDAAEAQRMVNIAAAQGVLTSAAAALEALGDDATDQHKLDAQRMVEAAANALRDALRMNGGSATEIEAAIRMSARAMVAADALQATITAAANAEEQRKMAAINTAQTALTEAEDALMELGEDATDKEKRDAHRAVEREAAALLQVLEDNDGTAGQITAATMKRDSAMQMADALTSPIEIADQRKAITDALSGVAIAVAAVMDDSSDEVVNEADAAIAAAKKAIADATELPEAETTAHAMLVNAHANVLATAKESRMAVLDAKTKEEQAIAQAASNKVALTKKTAITAEAGPEVKPFDGEDAVEGVDLSTSDNYRLTVKHTGSAVEASVTDGALAAKNDPMFAKMATFGNGQMLVRNVGKEREIIVVHTDIEAPDDIPFGTASGHPPSVRLDTDISTFDTYVVQELDGSKLGGSRIVSSDPGSKDLAYWAPDGDIAKNVFSGTLDGAEGKFRCTTSEGCTVATTADGDDNTVAITGTLWFTPNSGATVELADSDYLTWGFWLDTTTKDGAITSYDTVQTFARSNLLPSTGLATVMGTATYEGDAAGVYVHETKKEDGSLDTATSGRFTADVALKAYFEGGTLRNDNTIDGTISKFDLDGGPANSWKVGLSAMGIDGASGFSGMAKGGGVDDGTWNGIFHGPTPTVAVGDPATVAPPVLVGEFNANFVNGAAAGAYGARKQ